MVPAAFWPTLGNHDWDTQYASGRLPYLQYFAHLSREAPIVHTDDESALARRVN